MPVRKYWPQLSAMAADASRRLLENGAKMEPYTIIIMVWPGLGNLNLN
jgi:hypothetical protein